MRRSPRRPLILKRRKLPFQQNDVLAAESQSQSGAPASKETSKSTSSQCFPDGIRIMDHPSQSDTQVVVIPKTADLQSVIGALTAKGKECGEQGPNKFILLSGNGGRDNGGFCHPAAEEGFVSTPNAAPQTVKAETTPSSQDAKPFTGVKPLNKEGGPLDDSLTNIQWLGKMSTFEADASKQTPNKENQNPPSQTFQVKAVQQNMAERPPYSYMAMIQFAINSRKSRRMTLKEIYMWIEEHFPYYRDVAKPGWKNSIRHNLSLHKMFIRETTPDGKVSYWTIRPEANRCLTLDQVYKVTQTVVVSPQKPYKVEVKEEQVCVPIKCETPKAAPKRQASSSRRKQHLVRSVHEEPVLLCPDNTFLDSGLVSDYSTVHDIHTELDEHQPGQDSPDREFSFKTPIKSSSHLSSSTPSKPSSNVLEPWKVTPVGKGSQHVLDFSPIRTPGGPAVTPRHDYTTFSFNSTPFKDWPLFSSPRELLTSGLVLDTMNDSLSKIFLDISLPALDDEDLDVGNVSWSEFFSQFK
uniref:Forkhead box protein M1 n=1 Tax=Stegastes partitus TaxID=144197 RepID=A0A3B4ZRY7_9TELE